MLPLEIEKRLAGWLALGSVCVTLVVTDRISSDPANLGKMLVLSIVAGGAFGLLLMTLRTIFHNNKLLYISAFSFLVILFISMFFSNSPWQRGFYGAAGRNTGFLTYTAFLVIFLGCANIQRIENTTKVIRYFLLAGILNLFACLFYILSGHEIFQWNNSFGKVLGTFGNPDFVSAFLGMFVTALISILASRKVSPIIRVILIALVLVTLYVIKGSAAQQGLIIVIAGLSIIGFFVLRSRTNSKWPGAIYVVINLILGILGILGTLQQGPLQKFLYKPSITFRGEYWHAGINMALKHPLTGVGIDSYGMYYRMFRRLSAATYPGLGVVSDAAHNVFIDMLAGAGLLGLLSYVFLIILVLKSSIIIYRRSKNYDPVFVLLFTLWATYQLQSFVSINQIGLGVWGWVLGGLLIGYEKVIGEGSVLGAVTKQKKVKSGNNLIGASTFLTFSIGSLMGLLVALPSFMADAKERQAYSKKDAKALIAIAGSFPRDNVRMNKASVMLANSGSKAQAATLSKDEARVYPDDFAAWYTLYALSADGSKEKATLIRKLHTLDPFNPEFAPK